MLPFLSHLPLLHICENRLKYNFSPSSSASIEMRALLCKILTLWCRLSFLLISFGVRIKMLYSHIQYVHVERSQLPSHTSFGWLCVCVCVLNVFSSYYFYLWLPSFHSDALHAFHIFSLQSLAIHDFYVKLCEIIWQGFIWLLFFRFWLEVFKSKSFPLNQCKGNWKRARESLSSPRYSYCLCFCMRKKKHLKKYTEITFSKKNNTCKLKARLNVEWNSRCLITVYYFGNCQLEQSTKWQNFSRPTFHPIRIENWPLKLMAVWTYLFAFANRVEEFVVYTFFLALSVWKMFDMYQNGAVWPTEI